MTKVSVQCIVCNLICVGVLCVEPNITVSGCVGTTAVLPCKLQSENIEKLYIRWTMDSETVFERRGEDVYQGEGYEGRVDVPDKELRKGNCSLVLYNLKLTDAAVYTSYELVKRTRTSDRSKRAAIPKLILISSVELSVSVSSIKETNKNISPTPSGDAGMKCPHLLVMVLSLCLMFTRPALL